MASQSIELLINQYQILNVWFINVLDGIKNEDGKKVSIDKTNSLEWLCGHLITGRYRNLMRIGVQVEPYKYLDRFVNVGAPPPNGIPFDPKLNYSSLDECRTQWQSYAEIFMNALRTADEKLLKSPVAVPIPIGGTTLEETLAFVVMHETFHIGQMSLLRKSLGYSAMSLAARK